jgi:hypothetical protein
MGKTLRTAVSMAALVVAVIAVDRNSPAVADEKHGAATVPASAASNRFEGKYCAGTGNAAYLDGVANAVALRVADDATACAIYRQIDVFSTVRPFDFFLINAPGLALRLERFLRECSDSSKKPDW